MESDRVLTKEEQALGISLKGDKTVLDVKVGLKYGLCARSSSHIIDRTMVYDKNIVVEMEIHNAKSKVPEAYQVNAKSIMGLLTLASAEGSKLKFYIDGTDEPAIQLAKDLHERVTDDLLWGIS